MCQKQSSFLASLFYKDHDIELTLQLEYKTMTIDFLEDAVVIEFYLVQRTANSFFWNTQRTERVAKAKSRNQ